MEFNKLIITESIVKPSTMLVQTLIGFFKKYVLKKKNWRPEF